jgi:hypothetical protein
MRPVCLGLTLVFAASLSAAAQVAPSTRAEEMPQQTAGQGTTAEKPPPPQTTVDATSAERPTGLPSSIKWTFNLDAGWGTFGFANSLFVNPKDPGTNEDLSDQWFEGFVKPALTGVYATGNLSEVYGKISVAGERTYGSVPAAFGQDVSSFGPEDLYLGWRSGTSLKIGDNAVDVKVGRAPFRLGHGFLLYDGASEGGSRGGYWTNARKAFEFAAIATFKPGAHKIETFYLDRDELEENDSGSRLWGANYEFRTDAEGTTTLGGTYMRWLANPDKKPGRDGLNVVNLRAYTSPIPRARDLSFEFEYASERNSEALNSDAWMWQGAYEWSKVSFKPKLSYRFASFEGDDPATVTNEAFDPLFLGFYDWGTWWQGEIAGEYFLSNSNLKSHQVRAHFEPNDSLSGGLMFFKFSLDQPTSFGPQVTDQDAASEIDLYADWKLNENFTVSLIGAYADPGKAVQQSSGRTKNFVYGMVYVGYSF